VQHGQLLDVVAGREVHPVCAWFAERSQAWRTVCAGLGPAKVAISRIVASISLATVAAVAAFVALELRGGVAHPWHAAVAIVAFAWLYLGLGVLVGSLVTDPLEGSLIVVFVFILDVFSGPGMEQPPPRMRSAAKSPTSSSPPGWAGDHPARSGPV
jgi:hypothetical protein